MKKTSVVGVAAIAVMAGMLLAGCVSTGGNTQVTETKKDEVDKFVIVNWSDRALGEVSAPAWLVNMRHGNSTTFKEQWTEVDSKRVVKCSEAEGKTVAIAQALSRAGFAYKQAAELSQKVIGRVGQGINDVGELEALFEAASETKADMTGLREEHGFYQKVHETSAVTGASRDYFIYYTVYSMDKDTWDNLCKQYLMDIMGSEGLTTETQKKIGALFSEMKEDADKKDAKKQEEERKAFEIQKKRLEAAQAKANADIAASNAETAKAALKAKEMDAREAETKRAVEMGTRVADAVLEGYLR